MKEILKARQAEILKCLITSSTPLDIAFFQDKFHKGERTIRYDIGQLKEICAGHQIEIRYQSRKGYYIPASQKTECSQLLVQTGIRTRDGLIGKDEEERYQKIFLYLFVQKNHVTAERIAEAYFVSRSTLARFLGKMESYFDNRFFLDARKSMGYRLEGDELILRRLAAKIVSSLFRGSYTAEDWYMLLPDELKDKIALEDISEISRSIRRMNARFNIWISNMSYLNLLSYCIVRAIRLYSVKLVFPDAPMENEEGTYARELLRELSGEREGRTEQELKWLSQILAENGIFTEECMVEPPDAPSRPAQNRGPYRSHPGKGTVQSGSAQTGSVRPPEELLQPELKRNAGGGESLYSGRNPGILLSLVSDGEGVRGHHRSGDRTGIRGDGDLLSGRLPV